MVVGVIGDLMSGIGDLLDLAGILIDMPAEEEVGEANLRLLRRVEQASLRLRIAGAVVIGQRHAGEEGAGIVGYAPIRGLGQLDRCVQGRDDLLAEFGQCVSARGLLTEGDRPGVIGSEIADVDL